ncbi:TPA: hypothetical protein ACFOWQ_000108 [Neisseria meningitidis]|uniref:hypothetical protein n=1 Tax=Neisseria meningitidis TaxID=487 RepID=UPI001391C2A4|nr:hypothetical protein [Neisseria meningitidis]MBG9144624.1 hypothetical protein [Neisseria meningitidis]MBG9156826.1 hypothetical protein [Neisseria meningitidis]MBJ1825163.1 hypothetical protein [Neisseria meningitidis]MCV6651870.1 hypothetical protein [Neisseria meningitidis]MCV6653691.1 hypothetical protein [Neisseria meningitidis]
MPSEGGSAFRRHFRRRHTDFGRCKRQRAAFRKAADCGGCRISRRALVPLSHLPYLFGTYL